ncbi:MAG: CRISPR-associated endonuclease Cas2 [Chloroflexota bacterium]
MLALYIVTYDISDPKRLQRVFKTMRNYGDHLQLSVFECQLSGADLAILREKLRELIHPDEDQVLFIRLGPVESHRDEPAIEALGRPYAPRDYSVVVL